jgi:hypothetical protein
LVSIQRDITERKKAEQKLLEDQAKLKSLASELTFAEERERRRLNLNYCFWFVLDLYI